MTETIALFLYFAATSCLVLTLVSIPTMKTSIRGLVFASIGASLSGVTLWTSPDYAPYGLVITSVMVGATLGLLLRRKMDMKSIGRLAPYIIVIANLALLFVIFPIASYSIAIFTVFIAAYGRFVGFKGVNITLGPLTSAKTGLIAFSTMAGFAIILFKNMSLSLGDPFGIAVPAIAILNIMAGFTISRRTKKSANTRKSRKI